MTPWQNDLREFHQTMGLVIEDTPTFPPLPLAELRSKLVDEEAQEASNAIWSLVTEYGHYIQDADKIELLADVAKELCDVIYVALGTAVSLGIDLEPVWDAVHASNMAKAGGPVRADGKRLKPTGWQPPNIESIIEAQRNAP